MAATNPSPFVAGRHAVEPSQPGQFVLDDERQAIRCENPEYSDPDDPFEWYYAYDRGELALYHRENYFRPNAAVTRAQAQVVIRSAPVAEVVDRAHLQAAQKRVSRE